jgi:hypothetical protein
MRREADKAKTAPTSAQSETAKADTVQPTADNVQTLRHEVLIHLRPGEPGSDVDGSRFLVDDDVTEARHRDLYAARRRKARVGGVPGAPDPERDVLSCKFAKLPAFIVFPNHTGNTTERRSDGQSSQSRGATSTVEEASQAAQSMRTPRSSSWPNGTCPA